MYVLIIVKVHQVSEESANENFEKLKTRSFCRKFLPTVPKVPGYDDRTTGNFRESPCKKVVKKGISL